MTYFKIASNNPSSQGPLMLVNVSCMNIVSTQMDFHHLRNTSFELSQEINSVLSEQASFMCFLIKLQGSLFCG